MQWLLLAAIIIVLCFGLTVLVGPPYLPTLDRPAHRAIALMNLKPGQTLLELGCGDGKVLQVAAAAGLHAVGLELNPILVVVARLRTWRYRQRVNVVWGNFWDEKKWPEADGIFAFMLPKYMKRLDKKVTQWHTKSLKLISFGFPIPNKAPVQHDKSGVYLYEYQ